MKPRDNSEKGAGLWMGLLNPLLETGYFSGRLAASAQHALVSLTVLRMRQFETLARRTTVVRFGLIPRYSRSDNLCYRDHCLKGTYPYESLDQRRLILS